MWCENSVILLLLLSIRCVAMDRAVTGGVIGSVIVLLGDGDLSGDQGGVKIDQIVLDGVKGSRDVDVVRGLIKGAAITEREKEAVGGDDVDGAAAGALGADDVTVGDGDGIVGRQDVGTSCGDVG